MCAEHTNRFPEPPRPKPTGRTLVIYDKDADTSYIKQSIEKSAGTKALDSREFGATAAGLSEAVHAGHSVFIHRFKVAVVGSQGNQAGVQALAAEEGVQRVRPEFYLFAIDDLQDRYAAWVRDGLRLLAEGASSIAKPPSAVARAATTSLGTPFADNADFTWGLQAIGAHSSRFTGRGIPVAVLDTGLDLNHPDVAARQIVTKSFVSGQTVQDVQGHGTHTAGTVAGPARSQIGRRYGVAPDVQLHIGKVLNDGGSGMEGDILDGMNWAIDQKCVAISMSLGRPTAPGETPDILYERVGAAALQEGSLIIAAAGNESARDSGFIAPVGAPANSPSIMAVAAVDPNVEVAFFSCGGLTAGGGEVDISGPGVSVYSSFPEPRESRLLQGTSMACPHVAGLAALWAESDPSLRGKKLWDALTRAARPLGNARDFGSGLALAPDFVAGA